MEKIKKFWAGIRQNMPNIILSGSALLLAAAAVDTLSEWNDVIYYGQARRRDYIMKSPHTLFGKETGPCRIKSISPSNVVVIFECYSKCSSLYRNKFYESCQVQADGKTRRNFSDYDQILENVLRDALEK